MTSALSAEQWRRRDTQVSASRALASSTRAGIYEHLRDDGEAAHTVRDVAEAFDLHPNVARTHLELLADAGLVVVGLRKHPGGGRPAKVYRASGDEDGAEVHAPVGDQAAARLQVRLLAELVDVSGDPDVEARAFDVSAAEARRLVEPLGTAEPGDLRAATDLVLRALRPHAPRIHALGEDDDWADIAGLGPTFDLLDPLRPVVADAFRRGLLGGAYAAAGRRVDVAGAGALADGDRVWRVRRSRQAPGAEARVTPVRRVDARGMPREQGVVRAMREVTGLRAGHVLEVLAEGAGSPAAFARWVDRAGHELLGVERATDEGGRAAIRLLIRKGRG